MLALADIKNVYWLSFDAVCYKIKGIFYFYLQ